MRSAVGNRALWWVGWESGWTAGPTTSSRVGVELRFGLHVLLRVGYDPEIVLDSVLLEGARGVARAVEGVVGLVLSRRSPFWSATNSHDPKTKVAPSLCLVTMEALKDAITSARDCSTMTSPRTAPSVDEICEMGLEGLPRERVWRRCRRVS